MARSSRAVSSPKSPKFCNSGVKWACLVSSTRKSSAMSGKRESEVPRASKSLALPAFCAKREVRRSMSRTPLRVSLNWLIRKDSERKVAISSCLRVSSVRSQMGCSIQSLILRAPMGVEVPSSVPSRVFFMPPRASTKSRLQRLAVSMSTALSVGRREMRRRWSVLRRSWCFR